MWLAYAVAAAIFWGLNYAIAEQVMKKFSMPALIIADSLASILLAVCFGLTTGVFATDISAFRKPGADLRLFLIATAVCAVANLFIFLSIRTRNATMAATIEIAYPLFTAFFAWFLFREVQVTAGTLFGAVLIIAGVNCIYFFGKGV